MLQGASNHFGGVDDAGLQQVLVLVGGRIVAHCCVLLVQYLGRNSLLAKLLTLGPRSPAGCGAADILKVCS